MTGSIGGAVQMTWSEILEKSFNIQKIFSCPGWMAQLVGALTHTTKDCRFDSQLGHILRLQFNPQLGYVQEATDQYFSLTLMSLSLSLSHISNNISLGENF